MNQETTQSTATAEAPNSDIVRAADGGHDEDFFGSAPAWTTEVHVGVGKVAHWTRCDLPGACIWGLPGCGKSEFARYLVMVASEVLGTGLLAVLLTVPRDGENDPDAMMLEWGAACKVPGYASIKQGVRKNRLVEAITARAAAAGAKRVLVVIDSAEKLGTKGFELVASLADMIGRDGSLRPFTLLVGQLELREALKNFTNTVALQMHRRFFLQHHEYVGIAPEDLEEVLDSLDLVRAPSITQLWLAHRAAERWKLSMLAPGLRKAIAEVAESKNLTRGVRIPMNALRPAVIALIYEVIALGPSQADLPPESYANALSLVDLAGTMQYYVSLSST